MGKILPPAFFERRQLKIKVRQRAVLHDGNFIAFVAVNQSARDVCAQSVATRGQCSEAVNAVLITHRGREAKSLRLLNRTLAGTISMGCPSSFHQSWHPCQ